MAAGTSGFDSGAYRVDITGAAATTGGGIASIANPEGAAIFITRVILNVTTISTGAAAVNVGVGSSATTDYDNLIDGVDVNTAVIVADNMKNAGSNGKGGQPWPAAHFLNLTGSATTAGMVAELIIQWVRL